MPTITVVLTAHANPAGLVHMLGELRYQTRPADETIVMHSDVMDIAITADLFPEAQFHPSENHEDFGHQKRHEGLLLSTSDYTCFVNDDDSYTTTYLERMLALAPDCDAIYCAWNEQPNCSFNIGSSTAGNFVFATNLGKRVGYNDRNYEADGHFIDKLRDNAIKVGRVDDVLYFHNQGVRT